MRLTLDELKAMSDEELRNAWGEGQFPFELTECGTCLTQHTLVGFNPCMARGDFRGKHSDFTRQIKAAIGENADILNVREKLDEIYALRLFWDHLYAPDPPAPAGEVAEARASQLTTVCEEEVSNA